jgi:hypothetical protein
MRSITVLLVSAALSFVPHAAASQVASDAAASSDTVDICVIVDGQLREIAAKYDPESGDTTVDGRPLAETHPATSPPYLAGAEWYARDEMVEFERRRYVRYGSPRVVSPAPLTRVGEFRGIPIFAESRDSGLRVVYALVNARCEFQPYWYAATVGEVRGR